MTRQPRLMQYLQIPEFIQGRDTVKQAAQREAVSDVECKRRRLITAKINGARVPVMQNALVVSTRASVICRARQEHLLLMILFVPVILFGIPSMTLSPVMRKGAAKRPQQFDANVLRLYTTVQRVANVVINGHTSVIEINIG